MSSVGDVDAHARQPPRADAVENVRRILRAAGTLLPGDPEASVEAIAAAAGVSRATVYRHFGSRDGLVDAVRAELRTSADANQQGALRPAGELADGANPLSIPDVLNKVPPHLLGDQIVAEA